MYTTMSKQQRVLNNLSLSRETTVCVLLLTKAALFSHNSQKTSTAVQVRQIVSFSGTDGRASELRQPRVIEAVCRSRWPIGRRTGRVPTEPDADIDHLALPWSFHSRRRRRRCLSAPANLQIGQRARCIALDTMLPSVWFFTD